ncbi:uncharacterized protein LOC142354296 [Convolutriloba macropyga]|uniref:uncharacterized protein LOC142354296 n=1 Tax=Convolutriloba macropyga TaxID=536237 RepID=UPI003F522A64
MMNSSTSSDTSMGVADYDDEGLGEFWGDFMYVTNAVVVPGMFFVGLVLNSMGIGTLIHMGVTTSSTVFMLIMFSGDILSGFVDAVMNTGISQWWLNPYQLGRGWCKVLMWINYATTVSTQFILATFTFDRLMAVSFPIKYRQLKTNLKYPVITSLVVMVVSYLSVAGNLYYYDLVDGVCTQASYISALGGLIYFHYSASFVFCGLPTTLIFLFNVTILIQMRRNADKMKKSGREAAMTRVLLLCSFAFLFFTGITMGFLYVSILYLQPQIEGGPKWVAELYVALMQLAELPATANVSFNFALYLMGSKMFRDACGEMLRNNIFCCIPSGEGQNGGGKNSTSFKTATTTITTSNVRNPNQED